MKWKHHSYMYSMYYIVVFYVYFMYYINQQKSKEQISQKRTEFLFYHPTGV